MSIRTLIVDDETLGRERVRSLLEAEADFEVIGECKDGHEAVEAITRHEPDLVFLDIQMPGLDGFSVISSLPREKLPMIVFVTAYDQHALKAFEVHALDYLLKPFKQSRFRQTLDHVRETLAGEQQESWNQGIQKLLQELRPAREYLSRVGVRTGEKVTFIRVDQIDYIESAGNYVVIHVGKENHVLRETMTSLEQTLDPKRFIRVSRSAIVRVDQIKELQPMFKGEYAVILQNGKQVTMTRGLREVQELLKFS